MHWLAGMWAVLAKDLRLELRSRHAVNVLLIFVLSALLVVVLAAGQENLTARLQAGLLWIVILFAAALGLGRAFVAEEEQGTALLLRLNVRPGMVYSGKLCYSLLLLVAVNLVLLAAFVVLLRVSVAAPGLMLASMLLGSLGLAAVTTLLAAIVARSARRGPLLPMLMFPLLLPVLLSAIDATHEGLEGSWQGAAGSLVTLVAFSGTTIAASALLFDHVWRD